MTLRIELADEEQAALTAKARAQGVSAEQYARQLLQRALRSSPPGRSLAARIREIWADMPDEIRAKLPADGASQHDHYIYGVPKRDV